MKGTWEGLTIGNNGEFSFRDEDNFVTYRGHCVTEMPPAEENLDGLEGQRYLLFLSTDCGTTSYSCALFQRRDVNVLEFQLGKSTSFSTQPNHFSSFQKLSFLKSIIRDFPL